jgi:hypothetical protein
MKKISLLMRDIRSEVLAADDIPPASKFIIELMLDDSCHFAVLLGLEDALNICNFLDGGVGNTNDRAFLLRLHI